jgi:hypothetical protein
VCLVVVQLAFLAYLLAVRPLAPWLLQARSPRRAAPRAAGRRGAASGRGRGARRGRWGLVESAGVTAAEPAEGPGPLPGPPASPLWGPPPSQAMPSAPPPYPTHPRRTKPSKPSRGTPSRGATTPPRPQQAHTHAHATEKTLPPPKRAQWGEVAAHGAEAAILIAGLLIAWGVPDASPAAAAALPRALVVCYFLDLGLMLLPDLLRYVLMALSAAARALRRKRGSAEEAERGGAEEAEGGGEGEGAPMAARGGVRERAEARPPRGSGSDGEEW